MVQPLRGALAGEPLVFPSEGQQLPVNDGTESRPASARTIQSSQERRPLI
jgi:hypothetical protein